ncbi:hypothetical protein [Actinophytocola oryzae]|uniref:DUF4190 domain-containing protein n=1 Tax=Actinophytocola oryzae TaxID=502181 RepID=A0A4R7VFR1_9PSEU|nr:hypothetical protein [Actinophytocola oryzae]TDV47957.1 hypothetical protein CLV71_109192 [Actinophytocola oryzae]
MTDYVPPQAQTHPAPVYVAQPTNGLGTAALVLGILGLVFSLIPVIGVIAWPLVILGVIFGGAGISKAGKVPGMPKGPAIAGLSCSLVGLLLCILWMASFASA